MKTYFGWLLLVNSSGSSPITMLRLAMAALCRLATELWKERAREQEKKSVKARIWKIVRRMVLRYITNVNRGLRCDYKRNVAPDETGDKFYRRLVDRWEERRDEKHERPPVSLKISRNERRSSIPALGKPTGSWCYKQEGEQVWPFENNCFCKATIIPGCPSFRLPWKRIVLGYCNDILWVRLWDKQSFWR